MTSSNQSSKTPAEGLRESARPGSTGEGPTQDDRKLGPREQRKKQEKAEPSSPEDPPPNDGLFEG